MLLSGFLFLALGFVLILLGTAAGKIFQKDAGGDEPYGKHWKLIKWFFIAGSFAFVIGVLCIVFAKRG